MGKRLTREKQMLLAEKIINTFEDLLTEYNINIPNDEKNDVDNNPTGEVSNIYGTDYGNLEDKILNILREEDLISKETVKPPVPKYKCKFCKDTGMVQIGPNIRGIKRCPYCTRGKR